MNPSTVPLLRAWRDTPKFLRQVYDGPLCTELQRIDLLLRQLNEYAARFHHAVALFDDSLAAEGETARGPDRWDPALNLRYRARLFIAARDGAMTLFHIDKTIDALNAAISKSKALQSVDRLRLKDIRKAFDAQFPDVGNMRHSVAHSGELLKSDEERAKHTYLGNLRDVGLGEGDAAIFASENLIGRCLTSTYKGHVVSYELSWPNWFALNSMVDAMYSLFDGPDFSSD